VKIKFNAIGLLAVLLIATGLSRPAQAIVNIEGMRGGGKDAGISGSISLSLNNTTGNTEKKVANTSGRVNWQRQDSLTFLIASLSYGRSNDVRDTNKAFGHLRHIIEHSERLAYEAFIQAERNEFTRLSRRTLAGAGVRLTLHGNDSGHTYLGLGAFRSSETLDEDPVLTDVGTERLWRASIYLAIDYAINEQVNIGSTTYYQPDTGDSADYRLLEQAALKVGISDRLALKLSLDIARDSRPPQTIEKTDSSFMTGLEYSF